MARQKECDSSIRVAAMLGVGLFVIVSMSTSLSMAGGPPWLGSPKNPGEQAYPPNPIPQEPEEFDPREVKAYYDWRNDMFFRLFDMTDSGSPNFMTARRTYKVWVDEFGTPVVITMGEPLFYWVDVNQNGEFEQENGEMWSDPYEDGVTGNERLYDSSDLQSHPSRIPMWSAPDASSP